MKGSDFGRVALTMGVAVALLPGCGGPPPTGAPGVLPTLAIATRAERAGIVDAAGKKEQAKLSVYRRGANIYRTVERRSNNNCRKWCGR